MTRSVGRKRLKVIGLLLCLMMLALWVFSVMFVSSYVAPRGQWAIGIVMGRISFKADSQLNIPGWTCRLLYPHWKVVLPERQWTVAEHYLAFGLRDKYLSRLQIPAWLLVVAVGIPTGILWWRDRRPKAGFCKTCKYDLTGNVSGTCPECGTEYAKLSHAQ